MQGPLKVIKVICVRIIHGFDYYWTCIRIGQCETARKISCPFIDLSVFSVFITWALDDVDSKELSGSLSRNAQLSEAHQPEGGILNSWAVVFNQNSLANLLFKSKQQKKNLAEHQGMFKEKASLPDDMRRSKTPVLKLPQGLDGNSVTYYRLGSTNSPSKRPLVALSSTLNQFFFQNCYAFCSGLVLEHWLFLFWH